MSMKKVWVRGAICLCATGASMVIAAQLRDDPDVRPANSELPSVAGALDAVETPTRVGVTENLYPAPAGARGRDFAVTAGGGPVGSVAGPGATTLVYSNTESNAIQGSQANLPTAILGDDIATTAAFNCNLDRYVVKVSGDLNGDGTVDGDLGVNLALYPGCPRANISPHPALPPIAGTECHFDIPAAQLDEPAILTCQIGDLDNIPLRTNIYVAVSFSRPDAGVFIGRPALVGSSIDAFDHPAAACGASLGVGGFDQGGLHASFYTQIYVREPCGDSFVTYKNTRQSQGGFSPGNNVRFADDIHIGTSSCNMIAYEVSLKGATTGTVIMDLRTALNANDPVNGNVIAGTTANAAVSPANQLFIARINMAAPVALPQDLFVSFRTSAATVGPIATGRQASPGSTEDVYFEYRNGAWVPRSLNGWDAFSVTIICDGAPPLGSCCDMRVTENNECVAGPTPGVPCLEDVACAPNGFCGGESVCREVAEMNCPFRILWIEGGRCGPVCTGGTNDGQHCQADADCPGTCILGPTPGAPCTAGTCGQGGTCSADCVGSFCVRGPNNGQACTRSADCTGGTCAGGVMPPGTLCDDNTDCPGLGGRCARAECLGSDFDHPCGDAKCCTADTFCCNLTVSQCDDLPGPGCAAIPDDGAPFLWQRGTFCQEGGDAGRCPIGACIGRVGECTLPRETFCVGGPNDGLPCDPFVGCSGGNCVGGTDPGRICFVGGTACPGAGAFCQRAVCPGVPGCENPFCCDAVCNLDPSCCTTHWDPTCAEEARLPSVSDDCLITPPNDTCFHDTDRQKGALELNVPDSYVGDGVNATNASSDPIFCCWGGPTPNPDCVGDPPPPNCDTDCGPTGCGTLWYKFVAPGTSVQVETCGSNSPANDSMIQVFSIPDADRGKCSDLSVCSVQDQDCLDESECVFDEQFACENLSVINCNDDNATCSSDGGVPQPRNSRVCVSGLTVGNLYYFMVAAKTVQTKDDYRIRLSSPCPVGLPQMPNDLCANAADLSGDDLTVPFDLSGATLVPATRPATFDCPAPACLSLSLKNDIWYDWVAPSTGLAQIDTCGGSDPETPDTGLAVYDGCECPGDDGAILGCNDFQPNPCFLGARVSVPVVQDRCYKIRLGGDSGNTPAGDLHIRTCSNCNNNAICDDCEVSCFTNPICTGVPGCGTAPDVNPPNGIPDECEPQCPDTITLASSIYACDASLPRIQKNTLRLTFSSNITLPPAGALQIRTISAGGAEGATNLAGNFITTVEAGNTLKLVENGDILANNTWYTVRYDGTGDWLGAAPGACVAAFKRDYAKVKGDADGSKVTNFFDLNVVFGGIGAATDTDRRDMDGSAVVNFFDINLAFGGVGSFAPTKPDGHACSP